MKVEPVFTARTRGWRPDVHLNAPAAITHPRRRRWLASYQREAARAHGALVADGAGDHACYRCFPDSELAKGYRFVCVKHQLEDFLTETEARPAQEQP